MFRVSLVLRPNLRRCAFELPLNPGLLNPLDARVVRRDFLFQRPELLRGRYLDRPRLLRLLLRALEQLRELALE